MSPTNSCEVGSFFCHLKSHRFFHSEVWRLYFPALETWVAWCGLSQSPVVPLSLSALKCWTTCSAPSPWPTQVLQPQPCCESSLPLLLAWLNVSSLTSWLSDFHTVLFSGRSGCFLFLNLLSFFWLCKEAQCIYLCLHLGHNSYLLL